MKSKYVFLFVLASLAALPAWSFTNACRLQSADLSQAPLSKAAVADYKSRLSRECELSQKYAELKTKLSDYGIHPEQITVYQALRYIDRSNYSKASTQDFPISIVYQLPDHAMADLVWRNWALGIQQLEPLRDQIIQGTKIDMALMARVHVGFYQAGDEASSIGVVGVPGEIKTFNTGLISWPIATPEEYNNNLIAVRAINQTLAHMGLTPTPEQTGEPAEINQLLTVEDMRLFPGNPRVNSYHLQNLTTFLNAMLAEARADRPMIWKDRVMTPAELAYFVQQYIVQIHAFADGNGRTSRFWQDLILSLFDLPAGASGDLMWNDITAGSLDYYHLAMEKASGALNELGRCVLDVYPTLASAGFLNNKKIPLSQVAPSQLPYGCRILN